VTQNPTAHRLVIHCAVARDLSLTLLGAGCLAGVLLASPGTAAAQQAPAQEPPPRILLDAAPRAIEYQLERLSNAELARVERKPGDPRYRLVYLAMLTRKGLGREYFEEALPALVKIDKTTPAVVLLEALSKVPAEDNETADKLLRVLLAQPAAELRSSRAQLAKALEGAPAPRAVRAAYGGMMIADGDYRPAWEAAAKRDGHLPELLRSVPYLGAGAADLRARLSEPITALLSESKDPTTRVAAVSALASTRPDAATFRAIAREILESSDPDTRGDAILALQRIPKEAWPAADVAPLVRNLLTSLGEVPADERTQPAAIEAMQLAEKLADALPDAERRATRRDLRALGVQVVRIEALVEQMLYDLKWFAVEAGKPVQIVFTNPDAMSHNVVISAPGSLQEVGQTGSAMPVSSDPKVKPFVPDSPLVLQATRLLNWGETDRLNFKAPAKPGEYPFLCTFPGHWVRMYGVMLVVEDLEKWEANRTVPSDPMTNKPYATQR
jgi:azurin/DNA-binding transcriptional ArsR family regulator